MKTKTKRGNLTIYVFLTLMGIIMVYPLIWLFFSSFKSNKEIFSGLGMLPKIWNFSGYIDGWAGTGQFSFGHFMLNTFKMVLPTVLVTMVSSTFVAYGFARFEFKLKPASLCFDAFHHDASKCRPDHPSVFIVQGFWMARFLQAIHHSSVVCIHCFLQLYDDPVYSWNPEGA